MYYNIITVTIISGTPAGTMSHNKPFLTYRKGWYGRASETAQKIHYQCPMG